MATYRTFLRSARNLQEYSAARKVTVSRRLSVEEARTQCGLFNDTRTARQIKRGTKMEFEQE